MFVKLSVFVVVIIVSSLSASGDEQPNCTLDEVASMLNAIRKSEELVENNIEEMKSELTQIKIQIEKVNTPTKRVGSSYVRWGSKTCPADNEFVYKGYADGSFQTTPGGAASWICHTEAPHLDPNANISGFHMNGAESDYHHDRYVPCSLCRPPRSSSVMIKGRVECYMGWTKEYSGYIVHGTSINNTAEYICLDKDAKELANGNSGVQMVNQAKIKLTCVMCTI